MKTRSLGSGYELPFGVVVPPKPGFLRNGGADLYLEIADYDKHCLYRLNQVMFIFRALACSGALSGRAIAPTQSTLELGSCTRSGERQLHVPIHRSAIDDRALLVLANLLLAARRRLSVTGVRLDLADVPGSISVVRTPSGETTYPGRFEQIGRASCRERVCYPV